ncbi:hypothetical protein Tco_1187331 [Tanacetum coccineum]
MSGQVEVSNRGLKRILERIVAHENSLIYKDKTKKIHDSKIKNRVFNVGDRVLLFNSRLKIFSASTKPVGLDRSPLLKFSLMLPSSYLKPTGQTSRIALDYEDSRARGFVLRTLELHSLARLWESNILNLID